MVAVYRCNRGAMSPESSLRDIMNPRELSLRRRPMKRDLILLVFAAACLACASPQPAGPDAGGSFGGQPVTDRPAAAASVPGDAGGGCPSGCLTPPPGCNIKGNINIRTGERIYHVPGQKHYDDVTIETETGERWFCTESEAEANGWRRSKR
jgi:hypothetical protein